MKTLAGYLLLHAAAIALAACGASVVPQPAETDVARVAERYPETTFGDLQRGRELYLSRCTTCHAPVDPLSIPADRWPQEVGEMSERAGLGANEPLVVKYLVAQSLRASL